MKKIIFIFSMILNIHTAGANCQLSEIYRQYGWVIHDSSEFLLFLPMIKKEIKSGLADGSLVKDLSGNIMTNQTIDRKDLLMNIVSWDDLLTDRHQMYGDYAVFKSEYIVDQYLEVRWFDGVKRHIIFNGEVMGCVSMIPPHAMNTIF